MGWTLKGYVVGDVAHVRGEGCSWEWAPRSKRVSYSECVSRVKAMVQARQAKQYHEADAIRQQFLDEEATVQINPDQSIRVLY